MNRKCSAALAVLLIVGIGAVALIHSRRHRATPSSTDATKRSLADRAAASPIAAQPLPAPTHAAITADPASSADAWMTRSDRIVTNKNAKLFGTDAAHLLVLPPAEAWATLKAHAGDGDVGAATAALLLATNCKNLPLVMTSMTKSHASYFDHLPSGLPQDWVQFLRTLDAQQQDRTRARANDCADVGGVLDIALLALDRLIHSDDPSMQLAEAEDIGDDVTAISDLRQLADQTGNEETRRALGMHLMESADLANQAEGHALLEQRAANDLDLVTILAGCFSEGCGGFRGDPSVADAWVERASGLGEWWALNTHIADLQTAGQMASAWAWALYRLDLASAGCFEMGAPHLMYIATAAQGAFQLEQVLDATQQANGRTAAAAIEMQWSPQAAARLGCG